MIGPRRTSLLPAQSFVMSDRQLGFRSAPGAQLLRFGLLGVFEIIMGLHEEKPRPLPIADRMRLLQARLRLPSPHIDASHEPTPRHSKRRHCSPQSWQNVGTCRLRSRENLRRNRGYCPSGMRLSFAQVLAPKTRAAVGDRARTGPLHRRCLALHAAFKKKNRVRGWRIPPGASQTFGHESVCRSRLPV
jgi:hypothetical protein